MPKPILWVVESDEIKTARWKLGLPAAIANGSIEGLDSHERIAIHQGPDSIGAFFVEHASKTALKQGFQGSLVAVPVDSSDGLTKEVTDDRIRLHMAAGLNPVETSGALIDAALAAGGRDNVTAIIVDVLDAPEIADIEDTAPRPSRH